VVSCRTEQAELCYKVLVKNSSNIVSECVVLFPEPWRESRGGKELPWAAIFEQICFYY